MAPKDPSSRVIRVLLLLGVAVLGAAGTARGENAMPVSSTTPLVLSAVGDSLSHATMDGTNNLVNSRWGYLQKVSESLRAVTALRFVQSYYDFSEKRLLPFRPPTNIGIDGADLFSIEGIEYYKRAGVPESFPSADYLAERLLPARLEDDYDKVMYPINLLRRAPTSQVDAAVWLMDRETAGSGPRDLALIFWIGNNDTSTAAHGIGGANPMFFPFPFRAIADELDPLLRLLLALGERSGDVSFAPYTPAAIDRNMTEVAEFESQLTRVLERLTSEPAPARARRDIFLLTLPYYSAVGYLIDSEDLEFYLRKLAPAYTVPASFKRVAPPGAPIEDPFAGDRVSLFTFGFMYLLLATGHTVDEVNAILEQGGVQVDGNVMSEAEQKIIRDRIDAFNAALATAADAFGPSVHLVEIGQYLNDVLGGVAPIEVGGIEYTRKWGRGCAFSMDGVHPGYVGQAFIANFVLERMNAVLGLAAPPQDLEAIFTREVYCDKDRDGWVPGPAHADRVSGIPELLYLLRDVDDADVTAGVDIPADVWARVSDVILREVLGIPAMRAEAARLGLVAPAADAGE